MGATRSFRKYAQQRESGLSLAQLHNRGDWNSWVDEYVRTPKTDGKRHWNNNQVIDMNRARTPAESRLVNLLAVANRVLVHQQPRSGLPGRSSFQQTDFNRRATEAYGRADFSTTENFSRAIYHLERFIADQQGITLEEVDLMTLAPATLDSYVMAFLNDQFPNRQSGESRDRAAADKIGTFLSRMREFVTMGAISIRAATWTGPAGGKPSWQHYVGW